jgi:trigger factor
MDTETTPLSDLLANNTIDVPVPAPIQPQELINRFDELRLEIAQRYEKSAGQKIAEGDEIVCDIIGYAAGRVIPYSVMYGFRMRVIRGQPFPGLAEGLIGATHGTKVVVQVPALPRDYRVAALRGAAAEFHVHVRSCARVQILEPNDPALLKALDRGSTLSEVFEKLAFEMTVEREEKLSDDAREFVTGYLAQTVNVDVGSELVSRLVERLWEQYEGAMLTKMGATTETRKQALEGWLADETIRADSAHRIAVSIALRIFANEQEIEISPEELEEYIRKAAEAAGQDPAEVIRCMTEDPNGDDTIEFLDNVGAAHVMDQVMAVADVNYVDA